MDRHDDPRAEYVLIQGQYEAFDQRALSLKALSTPLLGTGLAFGVKEQSVTIVLATTLIALCLWILEVIWKTFQYAYIDRINLLERWFRDETTEDVPPFQIFKSWFDCYMINYKKLDFLFRIMKAPFVALPYAMIVIIGILVASYFAFPKPGVEKQVASLVTNGDCAGAIRIALDAESVALAAQIKSVCTPTASAKASGD